MSVRDLTALLPVRFLTIFDIVHCLGGPWEVVRGPVREVVRGPVREVVRGRWSVDRYVRWSVDRYVRGSVGGGPWTGT